MDKGSFILYTSYKKHLSLLTNEQKGLLLDALFDFAETGLGPELDQVTNMAFSFIREDILQNNKKWEETKEKRRIAGQQGGLAKASNARQSLSNLAVNVNVNENVNVNANENSSSSSPTPKTKLFEPDSNPYQGAQYLARHKAINFPKLKPPTEQLLQQWADAIDKLNRIDGFEWEDISDTLRFAMRDDFWQKNILGGQTFRKQFEKIYTKAVGK